MGHRVDRFSLHAGLQIPNVKTRGLWGKKKIKKGMILAIEPFVTLKNAKGSVYPAENRKPLIFSLPNPGSCRLCRLIHDRCGKLPFALRWIASELQNEKDKLEFSKLPVRAYPPLMEATKRPVSQAESTVLVTTNGAVRTDELEF